jgi:flagellar biosynthesis protein FlhG
MAAMLTASPAGTAPIGAPTAAASQLDTLRGALGGRPATRARPADATWPSIAVCASGRGGSGTTLASAVLALAAADTGHRTLLIDADDLVGPQALLLGVAPRAAWPMLRSGAVTAEQLVLPVSDRLDVVAGGRPEASAMAAAATESAITLAERRACFARLAALADRYALVVIDAGNRLDHVLAALDGARAAARLLLITAGQDPIALAASYALLKAVHARHPHAAVDVLANRLDDTTAARVADTLAHGAEQFLGRAIAFAGALPNDPALDAALRAGMPFLDAVTGSPVALAAHDTVLRLVPALTTSRPGA